MMKKLILFSILLLLAACGSEPECEYNSDCNAKECFTASCVDGECKNQPQPNCCGNLIKEEGENACSCPTDVTEKCEGEVVVRTTDMGNEITSEYLEYMCKDDKCVTGIDEDEQREIPLTFDKNFGRFKLSFEVRFNEPFNIDSDTIKIEGKLRSFTDAFKPPVKINEIKIIGGETLYGGKDLDAQLNEEGDSFSVNVPIDYVPEALEKEERLRMKLFYEETYIINQETGETKTPPEQEFLKTFDTRLFLVNPGEEK